MAKKGRTARSGRVLIGTSGWMYKDWGAMFYPKEMKKGFLPYLAQEFGTVEINSSFYHLPLASTFSKWRGEVPETFVFAVKLSRFITHRKKLEGVREPLGRFLSRARKLEEKLGPILIQLPPFLRYDEQLFDEFLESLTTVRARHERALRFALEPRHRSWQDDAAAQHVRDGLKSAGGICLVFPHSAKLPFYPPEDANLTADFTYVRFHGPSEWAASRYGARRLAPWAKRISEWSRRGIDVFAYFNNDVHGHAIVDARTLKKLLHLEAAE